MHRTLLILAIAVVAVMTISTVALAAPAAGNKCDVICQIYNFFLGPPKLSMTGYAVADVACSENCPYTISTSLSLVAQTQKTNITKEKPHKPGVMGMPGEPSVAGGPPVLPGMLGSSVANAAKQKPNKPHPTALSGTTERLFAIGSSEFLSKWRSPMLPPSKIDDVYEAGVGLVAERTSDSSGTAAFGVSAANQYLIIAKYAWTDANGTAQTTYTSEYVTPGEFKDGDASVKMLVTPRPAPKTKTIAPPPVGENQEITKGRNKK